MSIPVVPLVNPDIIDFKILREGSITDSTHPVAPIAAHGAVEDYVEMLIKRPDSRIITSFFIAKNFLVIQIKIKPVGKPLHCIKVITVLKICYFDLSSL